MNDYEMARENFVNMGEMMMRLIYQVKTPTNQLLLDQHRLARVPWFLHGPQPDAQGV